MSQSGARSSEANFVQPARAMDAPRATGEEQSQNPQIENRGHDRVVRVRVHRVGGERERRSSRTRGRRRAAVPPKRRPTRSRPRTASRSKAIAVACAAGSVSHLPDQRQDQADGDVGEVVDRAIRVATVVRRLAAAVRLDVVADVPLGVGGAAGAARRVRHVAVRRLAVEDPVAADHARAGRRR